MISCMSMHYQHGTPRKQPTALEAASAHSYHAAMLAAGFMCLASCLPTIDLWTSLHVIMPTNAQPLAVQSDNKWFAPSHRAVTIGGPCFPPLHHPSLLITSKWRLRSCHAGALHLWNERHSTVTDQQQCSKQHLGCAVWVQQSVPGTSAAGCTRSLFTPVPDALPYLACKYLVD